MPHPGITIHEETTPEKYREPESIKNNIPGLLQTLTDSGHPFA